MYAYFLFHDDDGGDDDDDGGDGGGDDNADDIDVDDCSSGDGVMNHDYYDDRDDVLC